MPKSTRKWSERQDLNLRRLGPKPSALARLSYAPISREKEYPITDHLRNDNLEFAAVLVATLRTRRSAMELSPHN